MRYLRDYLAWKVRMDEGMIGESMGAVKQVFVTLGLFFFLCPGTMVHAQEKMATYPPFAPGYLSIKVFDNQSRFVGRLLPERRYWASIDQIPIFLQDALVAIEDSRFYEHGAIDLRGITRALVKDVIKGKNGRGGLDDHPAVDQE